MSDPIAHSAEVRLNNTAESNGLRLTWIRHTERSSTGVVDIAPGGGMAPHLHEHHDEVVTILDGRSSFGSARRPDWSPRGM
jgi:quercetin dioxygenase-like cupin family protein